MPHPAVDVSVVYEIQVSTQVDFTTRNIHAQKLTRQNARLKAALEESEVSFLIKEIEELEAYDRELECVVDNLHKEVDQVVRAAKRLQHVAAVELNEATEKVGRAKLCIETIIEEEGDFLSDPDAFVASYCNRLDDIFEKLHEDLGAEASFLNIDEHKEDVRRDDVDADPLVTLNEAMRRKLLVQVTSHGKVMRLTAGQVEIERVNEEMTAELEYSAMIEPVSHPIFDFEDDIDAEAEVLADLGLDFNKPTYVPNVYASDAQTNLCIQQAVHTLTAQAN